MAATLRAGESLIGLAQWTLETFRPLQADIYKIKLLDRCAALAGGLPVATAQTCSTPGDTALHYARAGEHLLVFIDMPDALVIVGILYRPSDLSARTAAIQARL
ncbi:type II toxin-antitoxin system RelE/ParE family toxin [Limimaricola soesokkakensis]|uniref:type II toxin-antitoxin system RelE/ParE family toxin n=1 Tax=Limimaricola soesokkakensis TaxID=1343159 RepID=UPI0035125726